MHSNFDCIGFKVNDENDIIKILELITPHLYEMNNETRNDFKVVFYDHEEGIQIYLTLKDGEIYGMNPHFWGELHHKVAINDISINEAGDVMATAWLNPTENLLEGEVPISFSFPDYYRYKPQKLPYLENIQLSAFGHEIKLYKNEEELLEVLQKTSFKSPEGLPTDLYLADNYFIPIGHFQEEEQKAKNIVQFAGKVEVVDFMQNPLSGTNFYRLHVNSLVPIDVVVPLTLNNKEVLISPGNYIEGSFWLSGIIIPEFNE